MLGEKKMIIKILKSAFQEYYAEGLRSYQLATLKMHTLRSVTKTDFALLEKYTIDLPIIFSRIKLALTFQL